MRYLQRRIRDSSTSENFGILLAIVTLALFSTAQLVQFVGWDFDDSYIVYRIANNIIHGNGWTYNPGEAYNPSTSVLNTILIALVGSVIKDIPLAAHILAGLWLFFSGLLLFLLVRKQWGDLAALLCSIGLQYLLSHGHYWGLELHLFVSLSLALVFLESHDKNVWPILSLLVLTRPDGLVYVGLKWLKSFLKDRNLSLSGLLQFGLILLPWLIFSLLSFGQVLPDTFAQKVWQGNSGYWGSGQVFLRGLQDHLLLSTWITLMFIGGAAGTFILIFRRSLFLYILIFAAIQQASYILMNVPAYHWYYSCLDVAAFIAAVFALNSVVQFAARRIRGAGAILRVFKNSQVTASLILVLMLLSAYSISHFADRKSTDQRTKSYGNIISTINARHPEGSLAAVEVGTIGYHTDREIIDLIGLVSENEEYISGENNDLFFADPPQLVLFHSPVWHFEEAIFRDIRFDMLYGPGQEINDPQYPMQYFILEDSKGSLSQAEMEEYIRNHYPSFTMVTDADMEPLESLSDGHCFLDTINGVMTTDPTIETSKTVIHFAGWAIDNSSDHLAQDLQIQLISRSQSVYSLDAKRVSRPDVAKNLDNEAYQMAGYEADGAVLEIPSGEYTIRLIQHYGPLSRYCDFDTRLVID